METKTSIRKQILSLRNTMTSEERKQKSQVIIENSLKLLPVKEAEYVLCYAGYKSEAMTMDLITELLKMGKQVYLPKVSGEEMDFYRITDISFLKEGYKGIPEPDVNKESIFTKDIWEQHKERVVMILPGAAFSKSGARIGYGKGYYDRYLMQIPCMERIALCYDFQVVESIPADIHDIPVTVIVTETDIYHTV